MALELKYLKYYIDCNVIGQSKRGNKFYLSTSSNMLGKGIENRGIETFINDEYKLILYDLSWLTKPITHEGETFIPIEKLNHIFRPLSNDLSPYIYLNGDFELNIITDDYSQTIDLFDGYKITQLLLEWKFDVFSLIKNGLAVAVTEDFNPYK